MASNSLARRSRRSFLDILLPPQDDDPRVGSGLEESEGCGTVSTCNNKSSSFSKLGATFIPVSVILGTCIIAFIILRRRWKRVYAPRTVPSLVRIPQLVIKPLPDGWFNWIVPFIKTPDDVILEQGSLDAFFFLRYLKVLGTICLGGCGIVWPILLPIHATGGNDQTELEMLTMANVANETRFYAHAVVAWLYFGFVLIIVVRESIFYVNLRQAYLSSPFYADRLSSRTMLVAGVPPYYRDEARLRKLYGDETRKIWLPRTDKGLLKLVEERQQTAARLERAEVQLIKKANMARRRWLQKNGHEVDEGKIAVPENGQQPDTNVPGRQDSERSGSTQITEVEKDSRRFQDVTTETATYQDRERSAGTAAALHAELNPEDEYAHPYGLEPTLPDVRGSVAAKWLPVEARPRHRPLGNFMHSVDTIHWTRDRLGQLNQQIHKLRRSLRRGDGTAIPAAFIEFTSPSTAQAAHQVVAHHRPLQMSTRLIGVRPDEVLWPSLRMTWWERLLKRTAAMALIAVAIVFWSVPSAVIGMVSNIEFLANIPFMSWLEELPTPVLGFLQGFVPALALSLWMALVPAMIRGLARFSGSPTTVLTELFVQKAYFAFQVVQVFLVTTITTAASNALLDIVEDPSSAPEFLAQNIPRASNFYISYILIQCLAAGAFGLLHLFDMLRHFILPRVSELPRTRFRVWSRMRMVYWGGIFPVFSNLGVIVLAYAFIAPLILIFGAAGMWFIYVVYKYNLLYVFESAVDSKGLFYPRALLHIMVGLYIAEACLAGLLGINKAFGPLAIVIVFVLCTILVHFTLSDALAPLLQNLPQTLATEEDLQAEMKALRENVQAERPHQEGGAAASYFDPEVGFGDEEDLSEGEEQDSDSEEHDPVTQNRAMEGSGSVGATLFAWLKASAATRIRDEAEESGLNRLLTKTGLRRADGEPPSLVNRWLRPPDFVALRRSIPAELATVEAPGDNGRRGYSPPELWMPKPMLWIPKDEARVSRQEVAHSKRVVRIADQGAGLSVRGRVVISGTMEESPLVDDIDLYR